MMITAKRSVAAFLALTISAFAATSVFAAAPMAKTSPPGFFRMMLGDFEVTSLSDGTVNLHVEKLLTNTTPTKVGKALAKSYLKSPVETSVNAFLINTGGKLILIDAGAATLFGPTLGKLLVNLKASGYQPEQVDEVYISHLHPDHVGGLVTNGQIAFPNAIVRAHKRESDHWLSQANMDKAPEEAKGFYKGAMASLNPYVAAEKYKPFEEDVELTPGIKSYSSKGHTVGHSTYIVESKGEKLVLVGDLIHVGAVQLENPSVTITFDSNSKAAEAERKKEFSKAAKQGYLIGASHLPFPGLGHLRAEGKGFQWLPVNYTELR